ncbi:Rad17 cell cycle checkpoint protein-domain-containing protein [Neohortaea acidophila]|uniref:Rad17 cell cycle checkpoint protein-domain-containing protein n=1 Tax=Neohortaea acidophila TaxID=245834 RepID=A0A6A6PJX7_9PEZI|nr:Rad17 cell cycle checkpoint protein-domain-containing protein [Neohortaea acidophila]KAF2480360.1 Rad17 cell cycle checkpoint protein-domain-containing protein [Neohortaea acidophila]
MPLLNVYNPHRPHLQRKAQHEGSFDNEAGPSAPLSQKFRKASDGSRVASPSVRNDDDRPWTDQFPPKDLSELAVHKRKVADVRQWLEMALRGQRQRVLVLKGGAGSGKTTTVRLLAQELGLEITEWRNPAGAEMVSEGSLSAALQFEEFVGRAGRSGGLQMVSHELNELPAKAMNGTDATKPQSQLLLVEEFPNTFSRSSATLQSFRSAILQYLSTPPLADSKPTPIIMIISETLLSTNTALADSFTAYRLLGPELSNNPYLDTIEFNAIAPTILLKALENVVLMEARKTGRRRTPGPQVLKRLTEGGDIRSAISALEFLCLRGDGENEWSSRITFTKAKKSKSDPPITDYEQNVLKLINNRETTLDIFHAVGKVVYNKRVAAADIPHPPPWLSHERRNTIPENDVDVLVNEVGTDTTTFLAALHENYAMSCSTASNESTLDSMLGCISNISDADLLSVDRFSYGTRAFSGSATDSIRQDEMSFQVSVRGLWLRLPSPGDAHRMFYPNSLRIWKKHEEVEGMLESVTSKLRSGILVTDSQATSESAHSGVESWKRKVVGASSASPNEEFTTGNSSINSNAKVTMLTEVLPYLSQIMGSKKTLHGISRLRDDDEADVEERDDQPRDQWATDRSEIDTGTKATRVPGTKAKQAQTAKKNAGYDFGSSVEGGVQSLVLDDDDIEDD